MNLKKVRSELHKLSTASTRLAQDELAEEDATK